MKNSKKNIQLRHQQILDLLQKNERLTTEEIASSLDSSLSTTRRDLSLLAEKNQLIKKHGYCLYNFNNYQNFDETGPDYIKKNIARKAASFIQSHQTVFVNTSSTALEALNYINASHISIISNNVKLVNAKKDNSHSYILVGGEIRFPKEALVGDIATKTISEINADICIIGCSGIDLENGVTTKNIHEARVNEMMIKNTLTTKILVADYRKIGTVSKFKIANLSEFDYLITDKHSSKNKLSEFSKTGIKVITIDLD